ncbi:MAG: 2,3-bisphosphoglycerate-independent phosphoglycerate mutase [Candidatus Diapherotrites archaeon]|nr:2,3-bisphosphoglycerate-independent phosphoglycerate mutase [Candidatus Diapherotrites archaeon]
MNKAKILLIVCDGMGDLPVKELGGKTPLEAAKKPNMDKMAAAGKTGTMHVLGKGVIPESDSAHLTLFGYDLKKHYVGRGPFEALGLGINLKHGDIAFRSNFATAGQDLTILDRRAGRIENCTELAKRLDNTRIRGVHFLVKPGTEHRAAVVMSGHGLSDKISDGDPHSAGEKALEIRPLNKSQEAKFTAEVLNEFLRNAHTILDSHPLNLERVQKGLPPANYLLVRGAGEMKKVPSLKERFGLRACCIAGAGLYKGVAAFVGMDLFEVKGATGTPQTDIKAKIARAVKELEHFEYVFVHIKGCDIFGHDGKCIEKKKFIEKIDSALAPLLGLKDALVIVTADHSTPCSQKNHSADPVPVLFYRVGMKAGRAKGFGETACRKGALGVFSGSDLMKLALKEAGRA